MGIEGENLGPLKRCEDLHLRHRAHIADPLREDEIGLESFESVDIDLIHAAVVAQRRADG